MNVGSAGEQTSPEGLELHSPVPHEPSGPPSSGPTIVAVAELVLVAAVDAWVPATPLFELALTPATEVDEVVAPPPFGESVSSSEPSNAVRPPHATMPNRVTAPSACRMTTCPEGGPRAHRAGHRQCIP